MGKAFTPVEWNFLASYTINDAASFQFSFNDHNQNSVYGTTHFKADQTIGFGQFIWNKKITKHDLLFGAAFRYSYYDDNTTATFNDLTWNQSS